MRHLIPNVVTVIPPGIDPNYRQMLLYCSKLEEIQFKADNIETQGTNIIWKENSLRHFFFHDAKEIILNRARECIGYELRSFFTEVDSAYPPELPVPPTLPDGVVTPPISSIRTHDSQSQPAAQNLNFSSNPNISPAVTKNVTPNNQPVKQPFIFPSNSALLGPPSITTNTANQISAQSLFRETSNKSQPPRFPPFIEQYMRPNMHTNLSNSSIYPPQKRQGQQSSRSLE